MFVVPTTKPPKWLQVNIEITGVRKNITSKTFKTFF